MNFQKLIFACFYLVNFISSFKYKIYRELVIKNCISYNHRDLSGRTCDLLGSKGIRSCHSDQIRYIKPRNISCLIVNYRKIKCVRCVKEDAVQYTSSTTTTRMMSSNTEAGFLQKMYVLSKD